MSYSRLSEIDLVKALIVTAGAPLEAEMRHYSAGFGPWSYGPARASTSDIVSAQSRLLGVMPAPSWGKIAEQITRACKRSQDQLDSNLEVGQTLFDAARDRGWRAVQEPMGSLSIGFGESVRYWSDIVLEDEDGLFIPFFDHRRSGGLANPEVRRMVFSMQHVGVRERNPDLMGARLAVVRFPVCGTARAVTVHFGSDNDLLTYDELNDRVRTVYATWARISDERASQQRRSSGGG